jgi:hypothetical protein
LEGEIQVVVGVKGGGMAACSSATQWIDSGWFQAHLMYGDDGVMQLTLKN